MQTPKKAVSPGASYLIPLELQEILWSLHQANPLLPSIFEMRRGRGRYTQQIYHICLLPYLNTRHTVEIAYQPLHDIRVTILQTENGLLMRLSNKQLEAAYSQQQTGPEQGELF